MFLLVVCRKGYKYIVEILIKVGVDVNIEDRDNILLIVVCKEDYLYLVKNFIEVGFDVNF